MEDTEFGYTLGGILEQSAVVVVVGTHLAELQSHGRMLVERQRVRDP